MSGPERYKTVKALYKGPSAKIYLTQSESTKLFYLLKAIDITTMSQEKKTKMFKDGKKLEKLSHPCIAKCKEVYKLKQSNICIVTEYIKGNLHTSNIGIDLYEKLQKCAGKKLPEEEIMSWFSQILLALSYCHNEGIMHYNLSSKSVMFTPEGYVKVGNFGIGSSLNTAVHINETLMHESHYFAPEIIRDKPYTFKSDVWSLGVILHEMCSLKLPFTDNSLMGLALKIEKGSIDPIPGYSSDIKELITSMLTIDSEARPTMNQLCGNFFLISIERKFVRGKIEAFLRTVRGKEEFAELCNEYLDVIDNEVKAKPKLNITVVRLTKKKLPVVRGKLVFNKKQALKRVRSECKEMDNFFNDAETTGKELATLNKTSEVRVKSQDNHTPDSIEKDKVNVEEEKVANIKSEVKNQDLTEKDVTSEVSPNQSKDANINLKDMAIKE